MKKILFYISLVIGLALLFLFGKGNNINILAYSDIGNALGSYPLKLDIENYETKNLFNINNYKIINYNNNSSIGFNIDNLIIGETYTFSSNLPIYWFKISDIPGGYNSVAREGLTYTFTFRMARNSNIPLTTKQYLFIGINPDNIYDSIDNIEELNGYEIQIEKGNEVTSYNHYFEFGYNVHYNVVLSNSSSSNINAGIGIYDGNKYLYTANCNVPANSNDTICYNSDDPVYLPFNIDSNGYISFNYNLSLTVGPQSSITVKDGGLAFETVFNAYYKGSYTENLYFKQSYTMNNISLSGFSVSVSNSNDNDIIFPSTSFDNVFIIGSNYEYNISTNKKVNTAFTNSFNYTDFIHDNVNNIYDFAIKIPNENVGLNYNISISYLIARVVGDTGNTSPLPNNPNTINKYNECSAWYDIPCQLGNAITYVIYEAPIISPIINFFDGLIEPVKQFIRLIDQFSGFGILFGLGITAMLICIIKKMYGGGDS